MRSRTMNALVAMIVASLATAPIAAGQSSDPRLEAAEELFERYVTLEYAYDPALADLYADDAVIKNTRRYPTGQVREMQLTGAQYKALIRQALPLTKARDDRSTYSDVSFQLEANGSVTITASHYLEFKNYTSPLKIILSVGGADDRWRILEEASESQP